MARYIARKKRSTVRFSKRQKKLYRTRKNRVRRSR